MAPGLVYGNNNNDDNNNKIISFAFTKTDSMHKYNIFMNIFIYVNDAYEFEEASNQKNCLETNSDSIKS